MIVFDINVMLQTKTKILNLLQYEMDVCDFSKIIYQQLNNDNQIFKIIALPQWSEESAKVYSYNFINRFLVKLD